MNTQATNPAALNAQIDRENEAITPLFHLVRGEVRPYSARHDPIWMRRTFWEQLDKPDPSQWRRDDPRKVIPQLIRGRIQPPTFASNAATYAMSAAQVLDFVGVAESTAFHLQLAAETLHELLGEPKKILYRDRWLIEPRANAEALDPKLAQKFRVPALRKFQW